jgi:hypothetical protein
MTVSSSLGPTNTLVVLMPAPEESAGVVWRRQLARAHRITYPLPADVTADVVGGKSNGRLTNSDLEMAGVDPS